MTWGYIGAAAVSTIGGAMLNKGSSKGGTTTASKEPWAEAAPWLKANLQTGQDLQEHYQQNPFNPIQQASYANLLQGNDYINQMTPGLLAQFSQGGGFDRANPRAKPAAYQFPAMQAANFQPTAGLLGAPGGLNGAAFNPFAAGGSVERAKARRAELAAQQPQQFMPYQYYYGDGSAGGGDGGGNTGAD